MLRAFKLKMCGSRRSRRSGVGDAAATASVVTARVAAHASVQFAFFAPLPPSRTCLTLLTSLLKMQSNDDSSRGRGSGGSSASAAPPGNVVVVAVVVRRIIPFQSQFKRHQNQNGNEKAKEKNK